MAINDLAASFPSQDWRAAVWDAHRAGTLTRSARDVLLTLLTFRGNGGRIWPSHARLADRVRCSAKTVCRAMAQARAIGLVAWKPIRWRTPGGFWRRKSNLYALLMPAGSSKGHFAHEGEKRQGKEERGSGSRSAAQHRASVTAQEVTDARAALARIAADRARTLFGQGRPAHYAAKGLCNSTATT